MNTFRDVIEKWPTAAEFGRDVGEAVGKPIPYPTAVSWQNPKRGIPSRYWQHVVRAAESRNIEGVTIEALATIEAQRASAMAA